jgi:hypothetical protein
LLLARWVVGVVAMSVSCFLVLIHLRDNFSHSIDIVYVRIPKWVRAPAQKQSYLAKL